MMRYKSRDMKNRIKHFLWKHKPFWRLYLRNFVIVTIIVLCSIFIACLNEDFTSKVRGYVWRVDIKTLAEQYKDESSLYIDQTHADHLFHKVKVLCFILTTEGKLGGKVQIVNNTWARRCNKVLYVLCTKRESPDLLSTCSVGESKYHLTGKVRFAIRHSYEHYIQNYDWFLKADDDTYVIMENLRYLLSNYPTNKAGYLGYHFKVHMNQGYMSGGAGYVINRQALRQVVEQGFQQNGCLEDGGDEDVEIGRCLQSSSVQVFSSLDKFDRETFHTDKPWQHIWGIPPGYLKLYSKNGVGKGAECCSQFTVSYHHVDAATMAFMEHMLYRTSVYGRNGLTNASDVFPPRFHRAG
ncbi:glycoprotein-N-acetylgalactosamine 3-beta-galactosyltransferase 1-like [Ylistrum balloti]|uniref:glycoprotein-N-acetylgalactosamine 3-beta-galactosyltransferase 1-like n=1 Tax=Ylistrum balloti TaxID=509963 RepID=UPI002905A360|nr:glycoprotein-N-acetylgalactosamine 3-beta-galactosyltransferase 1-like [Ylistrum balloti]